MPRLSGADHRAALDVLLEGGAVEGSNPFTEPVLDALRRLVRCDVVAYHEAPVGEPPVAFVGQPRGTVTKEVRCAEVRYAHQDPLTPAAGARKYSDFVSRREFHRLELYQEVARPVGVEDMVRVWLEPSGARLEFDRPSRDFSERDREILDLLLPHLRQLRTRAVRRRPDHVAATSARGLLTYRECEVMELVAEGKTNSEVARLLWISPGTVRKHLENAYAKLGVHNRTGAAAALRRARQGRPCP